MHATEVAGDARAAELLSMYEQIERRHMFPFWARGDSAHDDISQLTNGPSRCRTAGRTATTSSPCWPSRRA